MINITPTNPIMIMKEVTVAAAKPTIPNINVPAIKRSNENINAPKTPARAPFIAPFIASPPTMYPTTIPAKSSQQPGGGLRGPAYLWRHGGPGHGGGGARDRGVAPRRSHPRPRRPGAVPG